MPFLHSTYIHHLERFDFMPALHGKEANSIGQLTLAAVTVAKFAAFDVSSLTAEVGITA